MPALTNDLWPYQRAEYRGAVATLYMQLQTRQSIGAEVLVEGRAGTGKSTGILGYIVSACYAWPGVRALIVRETKASLAESLLVTLEDEVLGRDHPAVLNGPKREYRQSYQVGASEIVIGGLDAPEKLFSTRWDIIYVAEAIETSLNSWELFGRSQRPGGMHAAPFLQRIADVNPGAPGHWLNMRANACPDELRNVQSRADYDRLTEYHQSQLRDRPQMVRMVSVHQDNPGYWDWDAWDWTENGRIMLAGLEGMSGHRRERMLHGLWVAADGIVFPEFQQSVHRLTPFPVPDEWPVYVFYDPGYDHPCAALWITVAPNGAYYVIDEIYGGGIPIQDQKDTAGRVAKKGIVSLIRERSAGRNVLAYYGDPQKILSKTQEASGQSIQAQFADAGIHLIPWPATGRRAEDMVEAVRGRLVSRMYFVFANCTNHIAEFQTWRYKRNAKGEQLTGDDMWEDRNNDSLDCARGAVALNLKHSRDGVRVLTRTQTPNIKVIRRRL